MKTKTIKVCDAIHVDVSCGRNDPVDVRCGGPTILGYDFFISPDENVDDFGNFIKKCLRKYHRPLLGVQIETRKDFPVDKLWTKKMIEDCIKKNGLGL